MANDSIDKKIESARHKEVLDALGKVASIIGENKNDLVAKAIENNTKEISTFASKLSELEIKVEAPIVNLSTDQQNVISAINSLKEQGGRIEKLLEKQNEMFEKISKPKDYEFEFTRNGGMIQSPIKAKVKN